MSEPNEKDKNAGKDEQRIAQEESLLLQKECEKEDTDPVQRKILLLDYLRRGRLADDVEIMPEFINALPKLLEAKDGGGCSFVDFSAKDYDHETEVKKLLEAFLQLEQEIINDDKKFRVKLKELGLNAKPSFFVDKKRHNAVLAILNQYLSGISAENLGKIKNEDPKGVKKKQILGKLNSIGLLENSDEELSEVLDKAENNQGFVSDDITDESEQEGSIKKFIRDFVSNPQDKKGSYDPGIHGFVKTPKLSEYEGEVFEPEQIDFKNVRLRANLNVVKRGDLLPKRINEGDKEVVGATIIDGNLGYKESGEVFEEEGITIIDHHDQFEKKYGGKKYDTATIMIARILQDELEKAGWNSKSKKLDEGWRAGIKSFIKKFGASVEKAGGENNVGEATGGDVRRLRVCVNHLDSDSILSIWAYRQPNIALKYRDIITKISTCGDFLLGSGIMEHGVTARDYEYIIRNFIEECQNKIKEQRRKKLRKSTDDVGLEIQGCFSEEVDLEKPMAEVDRRIKEVEEKDEELTQLKAGMAAANGSEKRVFAEKIKNRKSQIEELRQLSELGKRVAEMVKRRDSLKKDLEQKVGKALSPEENTIILNYLLDKIEDVIVNPFKYRKFLEAGRVKEQNTIETVEHARKSGEMKITPDKKNGIVVIEPGAGKTELPDYESIDGLYFFLRRRADLFLPIVVSHEENFVSVAINTQNARDLNKYDFNILVDRVKATEQEKIQLEIDKLSPLAGVDKKVDKRLAELQTDLVNNKQGKLWRNRTQMIFCMKTYQKFDDIMEMAREWKVECENEEKMWNVFSQVKSNVKRVQSAGKWGKEIDSIAALLERVPVKIGDKKPGFDAGMACALDLIPRQAQGLSAMLHANYTPEAMKKVRNEVGGDIENLDPDSETCWWLAACSVCNEAGGVDQKLFLEQIEKFKQIASNPEVRKKAATIEYRHMVDKVSKKTFVDQESGKEFEAPYGVEDGCIQGAYILGGKFGVCEINRPEAGNKYYELGTFEDSLGLEGFVCATKYLRGGVEKDSGPAHGSKQFYRFGSLEDLQRALAVVNKKLNEAESADKQREEMPTEMEYKKGGEAHRDNVREFNLEKSLTFAAYWEKMERIEDHGPNHNEGGPSAHTQLVEGAIEVYIGGKLSKKLSDSDERLLRLVGVLHDIGKADTQQFDVVSPNQNKLVGATTEQIKSAEALIINKLQELSGRDLSGVSKSELRKVKSEYADQIQQWLRSLAEQEAPQRPQAIVANFRGHEQSGVEAAKRIVQESGINLTGGELDDLLFIIQNHMTLLLPDNFNLGQFEKLFARADGSIDERKIELLRAMTYADNDATYNARSLDSLELLKRIDAHLQALRQEHESKKK